MRDQVHPDVPHQLVLLSALHPHLRRDLVLHRADRPRGQPRHRVRVLIDHLREEDLCQVDREDPGKGARSTLCGQSHRTHDANEVVSLE